MTVKLDERRSETNVYKEFRINKSVISLTWKELQRNRDDIRMVDVDRRRKTSPIGDRYIIM